LGQLATEAVNPATSDIDRMSALDIVRLMNAEDATVAGAVARELPQVARAVEAVTARLRQGGRLIYAGAGTSGRLGALDAYECPPTFSVAQTMIVGCIAGGSFALTQAAEDFEDSAEAGEADMARLAVGERDAVVGITASGRTPYALGAIHYAKRQGALTIGVACNSETPLAALVDVMIAPIVGPEVIAGSTRLKAGTAQKMVINMLSTGAMILLGKTYGNMMVDVQATNEKLRARATRIVQQATGLDPETAAALLRDANGEAKTAILAGRAGITPEQARERLAAHGGLLRAALEEGR
jgi:N-acetylmuramic acid 6-phosphate etherase